MHESSEDCRAFAQKLEGNYAGFWQLGSYTWSETSRIDELCEGFPRLPYDGGGFRVKFAASLVWGSSFRIYTHGK